MKILIEIWKIIEIKFNDGSNKLVNLVDLEHFVNLKIIKTEIHYKDIQYTNFVNFVNFINTLNRVYLRNFNILNA